MYWGCESAATATPADVRDAAKLTSQDTHRIDVRIGVVPPRRPLCRRHRLTGVVRRSQTRQRREGPPVAPY